MIFRNVSFIGPPPKIAVRKLGHATYLLISFHHSVPNAREAMDTFMMEAANELGDRSRFSASHHTVSYRFMS